MSTTNTDQNTASSVTTCPDGAFESMEQNSRLFLDRRMEDAGRRISSYLRHLPMHENMRHELALQTLRQLANDPGATPDQSAAKAMAILRQLTADLNLPVTPMPAPPLKRRHMKPEEMDRRPWVRGLMRVWRPIWVGLANLFNSNYIDIIIYALLLGGLYALFRYLQN